MEQIIQMVTEKLGISPEMAKGVVEKILGFLKSKLPESATSQLNSALGGQLDGIPATSEGLADEVGKTGLPTEKIPALMETVTTWLNDKLPEGVRGQVIGALTPAGGLIDKVKGWFGS